MIELIEKISYATRQRSYPGLKVLFLRRRCLWRPGLLRFKRLLLLWRLSRYPFQIYSWASRLWFIVTRCQWQKKQAWRIGRNTEQCEALQAVRQYFWPGGRKSRTRLRRSKEPRWNLRWRNQCLRRCLKLTWTTSREPRHASSDQRSFLCGFLILAIKSSSGFGANGKRPIIPILAVCLGGGEKTLSRGEL